MGLLDRIARRGAILPRPAEKVPTPTTEEGTDYLKVAAFVRNDVKAWPADWRMAWEERGAIIETECRLPRDEADVLAWREILRRPPPPVYPIDWRQEWAIERADLYRRLKSRKWFPDLVRRAEALLREVPNNEEEWLALGERLWAVARQMRDA